MINILKLQVTLFCMLFIGCSLPSNKQVVKPDNTMKNAIDQVAKSNQETKTAVKNVAENVGELITETTTLNETVTTFTTDITTKIDQKFETNQGSMRTEFETFKGEMKQEISTSSNSTWYGIGLVVVVLGFIIVVIVIAVLFILFREFMKAKIATGSTLKNFSKRLIGIHDRGQNG